MIAQLFLIILFFLMTACAGTGDTTNTGLPDQDNPINKDAENEDSDGADGGNDGAHTIEAGGEGDQGSPESLSLSWSNPETWGGNSPQAGDQVVIPEGVRVLLDTNPPALAGLTIHGSLEFDHQDLQLTSDWILVRGSLSIGSEDESYLHQALITLTGTPEQDVMGMGSRGLLVMGGQLDLHGNPPATLWTKIDQHISPGATQLSVLDSSGWQTGDTIVLAPTDFYGVAETEAFTLSDVQGQQLYLNSSVQDFRWGLMQYVTSAGMSLTPDLSVTPPAPAEEGATPLSLDERAEVGNLTRNIVIQSPNDEHWQSQGFGAHIMVMMLDSEVRINGVEVRRGGQAGRLGRYPFHWHRLSYHDSGNFLGDVSGHYLRNSTSSQSANRCITIHGTNGLIVEDNICFDTRGHAIFFEDAVERRNQVEGNLILHVRDPDPSDALKLHELQGASGLESGSSCLWVSNPDNTIRNNQLADCEGFGLWMAFPENPVGASSNVPMIPNRLSFGNFDGNVMHSNQGRGVMLDNVEVDDLGSIAGRQYASTTDGQDYAWPYESLRRFEISGWQLWKNGLGNFWNRAVWPTYEEFVSADSESKFFAGSGSEGLIQRSLIIGTSLNASLQPNSWAGPPTALASYHSAFDMRDNIIVNFPHEEGLTSGAFATDDYYVRPVDKGHARNPGNLLIASHPGHRSDASVNEGIGFALGHDYYAFAGALWDPFGTWGEAGNWSVYNQAFFTHGASCQTIEPASQNAVSCDGQYFGCNAFILDQANSPWDDLMAIQVTRYDESNPSVEVGTWEVAEAFSGELLSHMRHFAVRENGIYLLEFPTSPLPTHFSTEVSNMLETHHTFILGVRFSSSEEAQVYTNVEGTSVFHVYAAEGSFQQVLDSSGSTYWQDLANEIVWIKVTGGLEEVNPYFGLGAEEFSDQQLYQPFRLTIW